MPALGPRGEGWVALQLLAIVAIAGCGLLGVGEPAPALEVAGLAVSLAGLVLFGLGIAALGRSTTPFPRPAPLAEFRRHGVYRLVRHPIYGGLLLIAVGWSVGKAPIGLLPTAGLALIFELKSRREEAWLVERYPDYAEYRDATPHRFLPWLV